MYRNNISEPEEENIGEQLRYMRLGDELYLRPDWYVLCVPGGWIFTHYIVDSDGRELNATICFVPFSS